MTCDPLIELGDELAAVLATEETLPDLGKAVDLGGDDGLRVVDLELALLGPAGELLDDVGVLVLNVENKEACLSACLALCYLPWMVRRLEMTSKKFGNGTIFPLYEEIMPQIPILPWRLMRERAVLKMSPPTFSK